MPLYDEFVRTEHWGNPQKVREALDLVWVAVQDGREADWSAQLDLVDENTPHADDFASVVTTFAQYVCGCLDLALLAMGGTVETGAAYNTFEAMRTAACLEQTGEIDIGSGPEGDRFEATLISDVRVRRELMFQGEDLAVLEAKGAPDYRQLRHRAAQNRWPVEALMSAGTA